MSSTPKRLVWNTNMAAVSLLWNTNLAAVSLFWNTNAAVVTWTVTRNRKTKSANSWPASTRSQKQLCRTSSVIQSHSRFLSGESVSAVRTCFEIWFVHLNRRHLPRLQAIPTSLLVHYSKKRRTRRCRRTSRCAGRERGSILAVMSASIAMHIVHPKPESAKMELKMPAWDAT